MTEYDNTNKGAGWIKTANSGLKYISCKLNVNGEDINISIFKNEKKTEGSSQPDYNMIVNEQK